MQPIDYIIPLDQLCIQTSKKVARQQKRQKTECINDPGLQIEIVLADLSESTRYNNKYNNNKGMIVGPCQFKTAEYGP
jgi:hypothetical protein